MTPLQRRAKAAQETLEAFRKRPFRLGITRCDCLTMLSFYLEREGHPVDLKLKPYKTVAQAKAELKRHGAKHVGELFDRHFERVPFAGVIVGDLVALEGQRGIGGMGVALGNGRIVAYHEDIIDKTADVLQPHQTLGAWRVPLD